MPGDDEAEPDDVDWQLVHGPHRRATLDAPRPLFERPSVWAYAPEGSDRALEVLRLERRGHLDAHARRPFRNDREAEAGHEDAFVEESRRESHRLGGLADDDRDDRRLAVERFVAGLGEQFAGRSGVLAQSREELGCSSMNSIERSALHATVGGSAFEKSCGRERCASTSQTSSEAAT